MSYVRPEPDSGIYPASRHAYHQPDCRVGQPGIWRKSVISSAASRAIASTAFVQNPFAFVIQFVEQLLVLLFFRDRIRALHDHDLVIDPLSVVSAELWQAVHTEPQETVVCKLKRLLPFELRKQTVAAGNLLECL